MRGYAMNAPWVHSAPQPGARTGNEVSRDA